MAYEWAAPAIALLSGAACFGKVSQMATESKAAFVTLVTQNREDHHTLFDALKQETAKRSDEDNAIRQNFVSWQKCQDCPARTKK
jgi:hypothetical protein